MSEKIKNMSATGRAESNLTSGPGGPSVAQMTALTRQAKSSQVANGYALVDGAIQASNEFPYVPFASDQYDDVANIKRTWVDKGIGGRQATAVVTLDKDDANYVMRQREQLENADYDRWVMQKYDLTDPAQNFLMQQIAPDQFQRRLDLIDYQQSLVSKYARIRLLGAKSQEDLKFEWMIETGRIELPQGPIWDPKAWMSNQFRSEGAPGYNDHQPEERGDANRKRFMRGLFNPLNALNEKQTGWQPNENPSDIRGEPRAPTFGQLFAASNAPRPIASKYGVNPIWNAELQSNNPRMNAVSFGTGFASNNERGINAGPTYPAALPNKVDYVPAYYGNAALGAYGRTNI